VQAQSAEPRTTLESLKTVTTKLTVQDVVIEDLATKLDEIEEAFFIVTKMKKAANPAEAKVEHSQSTSSGDAMTVHPREPRVLTCTNDAETAFTSADIRSRPYTPQERTSRGLQAQCGRRSGRERSVSGKESARPTGRRRPLGVVVTTAVRTAAVDLTIPHEAAERVTKATSQMARRSARRMDRPVTT